MDLIQPQLTDPIWTIYVLSLTGNRYYVGRCHATLLETRLNAHEKGDGDGAVWTEKYPPIQHNPISTAVNRIASDETVWAKMLMACYGIDNVRGGPYSQVVLPKETFKLLLLEIRHDLDLCFQCGLTRHFIGKCLVKSMNLHETHLPVPGERISIRENVAVSRESDKQNSQELKSTTKTHSPHFPPPVNNTKPDVSSSSSTCHTIEPSRKRSLESQIACRATDEWDSPKIGIAESAMLRSENLYYILAGFKVCYIVNEIPRAAKIECILHLGLPVMWITTNLYCPNTRACGQEPFFIRITTSGGYFVCPACKQISVKRVFRPRYYLTQYVRPLFREFQKYFPVECEYFK